MLLSDQRPEKSILPGKRSLSTPPPQEGRVAPGERAPALPRSRRCAPWRRDSFLGDLAYKGQASPAPRCLRRATEWVPDQ